MRLIIEGLKGQIRTVDLPNGPVLLYGPNGAGKTTILDAIRIALTGRLRDGVAITREVMAAYGGAWRVRLTVGQDWIERRCSGGRVFTDSSFLQGGNSADHEAAIARALSPKVFEVHGAEVVKLGGNALWDLGLAWGGSAMGNVDLIAEVATRSGVAVERIREWLAGVGAADDAGAWILRAIMAVEGLCDEAKSERRRIRIPDPGDYDEEGARAAVARLEAAIAAADEQLRQMDDTRRWEDAIREYEALRADYDRLLREMESLTEPVPPTGQRPQRVPVLDGLRATVAEIEAALREARTALAAAELTQRRFAALGPKCPTCGQPVPQRVGADLAAEVEAKAAEVAALERRYEVMAKALRKAEEMAALAAAWERYDAALADFQERRAELERQINAMQDAIAAKEAEVAVIRGLLARAAEKRAKVLAERDQAMAALAQARAAVQRFEEIARLQREYQRLDTKVRALERVEKALREVSEEVVGSAYRAVEGVLGEILQGLGTPRIIDGRLRIVRGNAVIEPAVLSGGESVLYALAVGGALASRWKGAALVLVDNAEVVDQVNQTWLGKICQWLQGRLVTAIIATSQRMDLGIPTIDLSDSPAQGALF